MREEFDLLGEGSRSRLVEEQTPARLEPMLATLTDEHFSDPDWIFERKLDGERALAHRTRDGARLASRNGESLASSYPELVEALSGLDGPDLVIDGEVVAFDGSVTSFSRLQGRMQKQDPQQARATGITVYYYAFDLLHLDGYSTRDLPLRDRKRLLRDAVDFADPLRVTPHRNEQGEALPQDACRRGWEGLLAKRAASPYRQGRSRDWLKFKCVNQQELVVGGYTDPRGERTGFGALLVGYNDGDGLRYAGKVGTGYDQQTLADLRERLADLEQGTSPFVDDVREAGVHWVAPRLVAEVGFTEWTHDGRLRHPRFQGLRRDKRPEDIVREQPPAGRDQ